MVDQIIARKLEDRYNINANNDLDSVKFYVQFYNLSNFKANTSSLRNILTAHVKPTDPNSELKIIPYYKPKKISSMFSTRHRETADEDRCNVVYTFNCKEDTCNASYYGYTTQKLGKRIKQHRQASSSIYKHYSDDHGMDEPPLYDTLRGCFTVSFADNDACTLRIVEAIYIKQHKPVINVQNKQFGDIIRLF